MGTRIRLSKNPVTPRKPPMLFLRISQNFSISVGSACCKLGICFSTYAWMRWRSAVVSFGGLGAIASAAGGVSKALGVGETVGWAWGEGGGAGPTSQVVKIVEANFVGHKPRKPNDGSNRRIKPQMQ